MNHDESIRTYMLAAAEHWQAQGQLERPGGVARGNRAATKCGGSQLKLRLAVRRRFEISVGCWTMLGMEFKVGRRSTSLVDGRTA
jgi:hypothetical protein